MHWASIARHYGLKTPYEFRVAIPFLMSVLELIVVFIVCIILFASGGLHIGTERFYFFTYVAGILFLAGLLSRMPILSLTLLSWCTLESSLALATSVLERYRPGISLFPSDEYRSNDYRPQDAYVYHFLLQGVPRPNWHQTVHVEVPEKVRARKPEINWNEVNGRDITYTHNSLGLRGRDLNADDLNKEMIFVYGGSSTYDLGVTQGATWVERLQSELQDKYTILNFGVPGYSTSEHLIQTVFYESVRGRKPICAIYYVGWNDIRNAHIDNLDSAYADFHLPSQTYSLDVRKPGIFAAKYSPVARFVYQKAKRRFDSLPEPPSMVGKKPSSGSDTSLERIFSEHISTIASINNARGIRSVFIGQILNRERLTSDRAYGWLPLVRDKDVWDLQEHFNGILQSSAVSNRAKYIDAGIDNFRNSDFVDNGHFSASGARKFARIIAPEAETDCK